MNTKTYLSNLINSIFTTNGMKSITGKQTRETLNTFLNSVYLPAGFPADWFGKEDTIPEGWHLCDGSSFLITEYPDLFKALGSYLSPYGVDVANGKFKIPNIPEGSSLVQCGSSYKYNLGDTDGEKTHTLKAEELPNINAIGGEGKSDIKNGGYMRQTYYGEAKTTSAAFDSTYSGYEINLMDMYQFPPLGSNKPHNNMPPYMAVNKIIKLW